uniref:U-box domain-containing protein n=1 Tax=Opuntia streptacantha TaxID=393608 RepID=A0A7C8ZYL9_OPUST
MREIGMSIPQFFICPISLELFRDPVTLCTGQTYDRPCIEKWIAAGNLTCPVTMQKLHDLSMVPNHTLRHLIDQWLRMSRRHHHHHNHGQFDDSDQDHCNFCKVGSSDVSLLSLKQTLESKDSVLEQKIQALEKIRYLSEDLPTKNEGLIQMGFFPLILGVAFGARLSQEMMELVEKALDCALKLMPFSCLGDSDALMEESKFEYFRVLFKDGTFAVKKSLFKLIEALSMSSSFETKELTNKIGNETKVLQGLITSLDDYQQNSEVSEAAIKAILSLLTSTEGTKCRENFVKQGLIHSLVTYILEAERKEKNMAAKATRALEMVLELESGKKAFLENEVPNGGVRALVKMVFRVSGDDEGSESAVNSLMILCCESLEVREEAICGGILTQLLLLLQSQCSGRTKTRARMLLKLLRSMWAKGPKHV